ncbi:MAG: hypothetical protein MJ161_03115 [Clostridia bacterium]|nr:hypothetical protein [Clostridia bacterium]
MKRILPFFISFIFASVFVLSGCGEFDRSAELEDMLDSNESSLEETFSEETCEYDMFNEYMASWAKSSNVELEYKGKHSTVLVNRATEGCGDEPSTVLLCNINTSDITSSLGTLATAETTLLGPEKHGKITLVITEKDNGRFTGMEEIPEKYLSGDNLINMQPSNSDTVLISGPRHAVCKMHKSGKTKASKYANAYEIKMTMPEYTDPYDFVKENYPNPINIIGSLLATQKSSGKLFDIAAFSCKCHEGYTPYSATAVIVIDDNNVESFNKKFTKAYENAEKKFDKLESDFVFTFSEVELPDKVLDEEVSNNLISLMYTLNTGICLQDEETGVIDAASYISSIKTDKGNLDITIDLRTRGVSYLDSISTEYQTTAGLCSTDYSCSKKGLIWASKDKSELKEFFTEAVPLQNGDSEMSIRTYENDFISMKHPDQNMIIYTFEGGHRASTMENIINFMDPDYSSLK